MRRYFMTCPEAVSLVMQAAALGQGGEIFVLDMGQPVSIMQLADTMIRQAGKEPGRDIAIEVTGIRPGEKLYEEPYFSTEEAEPTDMPGILRARATKLPRRFVSTVRELLRAAARGAPDEELRRCLAALVPDYDPRTG
jgi:FlaA1/EpsC-like NDP-sugar epimerase